MNCWLLRRSEIYSLTKKNIFTNENDNNNNINFINIFKSLEHQKDINIVGKWGYVSIFLRWTRFFFLEGQSRVVFSSLITTKSYIHLLKTTLRWVINWSSNRNHISFCQIFVVMLSTNLVCRCRNSVLNFYRFLHCIMEINVQLRPH